MHSAKTMNDITDAQWRSWGGTPPSERVQPGERDAQGLEANYCQTCFVNMGPHNPRQLCGKYRCRNELSVLAVLDEVLATSSSTHLSTLTDAELWAMVSLEGASVRKAAMPAREGETR